LKVLLDTHAFLWWVADNPKLSRRAREIIGDSANEVFFSAASGWEIAIKARLGRRTLSATDLERFVAEQLATNDFQVLAVELQHALRTCLLPDHDKDPFDRLLVAQAAIEDLTLISANARLADYQIRVLW
jgi:PIN domain nuclease of toxin-antitoxin system